MKYVNNFIRGLIKGGVIAIMILSLPVKIFNYFADDFQGRNHDRQNTKI